MLILTFALLAGCKQSTAYEENDKMGYTVSVKFDAGAGSFTSANTPVIVDSFNISKMEKNSEGNVEIPLMSPENRKNITMQNGDLFLVGWYEQRTQNPDGTYTYSEPWDFEKDRVIVSPNQEHSSQEPVKTLYAAWAPQFTVEFCNMDSPDKEVLSSTKVPPEISLAVPSWNTETGTIQMGGFPTREGYTYAAAYYDAEGTLPVEGESLVHTGKVNRENGTVENPNMKIYISWKTGNWYRIYTAKQFADNDSLSGNYEIMADLDFTDGTIWPSSYMHGDFSGVILGNGHTIKGAKVSQTNANKMNTGLFGGLTETAVIQDLTFTDVSLTISKGSRLNGATYGLLAGSVATGCTIQNVSIQGGTIWVDPMANLQPDSYLIGLTCGLGTVDAAYSDLNCQEIIPENGAPTLKITVDGVIVTVQKLTDVTEPEGETPVEDPVAEPIEEPTEASTDENENT